MVGAKDLWVPGWGTFFLGEAPGTAVKASNFAAVKPSVLLGDSKLLPAPLQTTGLSRNGSPWVGQAGERQKGKARDGSKCDPDEKEHWEWLNVLSAMSTSPSRSASIDSTPFLRLGGSVHTDMSGLCHEVSRAPHRGSTGANGSGASAINGSNSPGRGVSGGGGKGPLWRLQQKALVEAALEEGLRLVHVPGLEGSAWAGAGPGGGGSGGVGSGGGGGSSVGSSGGGNGAPWPGPAGYSFVCWIRFNPPEALLPASVTAAAARSRGGAGRGRGGGGTVPEAEKLPEMMQSWGVDATKALRPGASAASAEGQGVEAGGAGGDPVGGAAPVDHDEHGELGLGELDEGGDLSSDKSPVLRSIASPGRGGGLGTAAAEKMAASKEGSTGAGAGVSGGSGGVGSASPGSGRAHADRRGSMDIGGERLAEEDESVPRPHVPGRQVTELLAA